LNNDQVSSGVWFLIGLAICLGSIQYRVGTPTSPGAGFMPILAGGAISFFSGVGFLHATLRKKRGEGWSSPLQGFRWKNALVILLSLLAYALLLVPLGFFLCTALFIAFLFRAIAPQRWPVVIGGALLSAIASYLIFGVWLKVQLPKGPFGI
jgi:putative tricarboxylic transport membrane protein